MITLIPHIFQNEIIKKKIFQLFVKQINDELSELANLIVAQDTVGCVLKVSLK